MKTKKKDINIIIQHFYGNKTCTEIDVDKIDTILQGIIDPSIVKPKYKFDRTIVRIPNTDNLVLVYNKYQEDDMRKRYADYKSAYIPEIGLTLYSRCFVCRMNNGEFESVRPEDASKFMKYLSD